MRKEFCEKDGILITYTNDNDPIHFHITKGNLLENDTKVWGLANGS